MCSRCILCGALFSGPATDTPTCLGRELLRSFGRAQIRSREGHWRLRGPTQYERAILLEGIRNPFLAGLLHRVVGTDLAVVTSAQATRSHF